MDENDGFRSNFMDLLAIISIFLKENMVQLKTRKIY